MVKSLNRYLAAGLMLFSSPVLCRAGESIVRNFDGWTVTITPGKSNTAPAIPRQLKAVPALSTRPERQAVKPQTQGTPVTKNGIVIRPISFEQVQSVPAPAAQAANVNPVPALESVVPSQL